MADYTSSRVEELPELWDGFCRLVRKGLGIESFGVNLMEIPPDYTTGAHDEAGSGQEELYVAMRGSGWVLVGPDDDGEEALDARRRHDGARRAGRAAPRALRPGGLRVLIVGGAPGQAYSPIEWSS